MYRIATKSGGKPLRWSAVDKAVKPLCEDAASMFKSREIKKSIALYQKAYQASEPDSYDRAFVCRMLVSTLIRVKGYSYKDSFLAEARLKEAIRFHQENNMEHYQQDLEHQKCLDLLCKVASDLKDGKLIKQSAKALLAFAQKYENHLFQYSAFNYLYAVYFSSGALVSAEMAIMKCISLGETYGIEHSTSYRHLAKLKLVQLQNKKRGNIKEILREFNLCYEAHKKLPTINKYGGFNQNKLRLLRVDLIVLFQIKAYEFSDPKRALTFVQAEIFSENLLYEAYPWVPKTLNHALYRKCEELLRNGSLPLAHKYFETPPPLFMLPDRAMEKKEEGLVSDKKHSNSLSSTEAMPLQDQKQVSAPQPFYLTPGGRPPKFLHFSDKDPVSSSAPSAVAKSSLEVTKLESDEASGSTVLR